MESVFLVIAFIVIAVILLSRLGGDGTGRNKLDHVFAGVAPGVIPADPEGAPTRAVTKQDASAPVAVRFEPPERMRPEEIGVIGWRGTRGEDIGAAFVAMAVEGYYTIEQAEGGGAAGDNATWRLRQKPDADISGLDPLRASLYGAIFAGGPEITLEEAKGRLAQPAQDMRLNLDLGAVEKGWYTPGRPPARTATGSALAAQLAGFHEYLTRAEGNQVRYEEAAGVFSRYLPWAVGLGVTQVWAEHFADVARQAETEGYGADLMSIWMVDLVWLSGLNLMMGGALFAGFGEAIGEVGAAVGDFAGEIGDFAGEMFGDLGELGFGDGGEVGDMGGAGDLGGGDGGGFFDGFDFDF